MMKNVMRYLNIYFNINVLLNGYFYLDEKIYVFK